MNPRPWPSSLAIAALLAVTSAGSPAASNEFLAFIRQQAAELRAADQPPASRADWDQRRLRLRAGLEAAWGGFPTNPVPLNPRILGSVQRDGYRIERLVFQTLPGVWMTANAYVPDQPGPRPALLAVHGHWRGAKQDPVVQARCRGPARLGYFVLAVDAFGAGERGVGEALGEYHGEMTAATLLPVGRPLAGLQVYENMRAVDYLRSRPEVDPDRIGVTGASGGGNQTMYAGAWDERLRAVVPVCSVGNYQAYLGAACCLCEVVPGALRFTEEGDVLGLTAPRGLLVINATRDAHQFSVTEARRSLARATSIYELLGQPGHVRHAPFESGHDYNQPMREAMYGWLAWHLAGRGSGEPVPEPAGGAGEDPESLRCFPGDTRPDDWMTLPRFAARESLRILAGRTPPEPSTWPAEAALRRRLLREQVMGGFPAATPLQLRVTTQGTGSPGSRQLEFQTEPGLTLTAHHEPAGGDAPLAVLLDLDAGRRAATNAWASALRRAGWSVVTLDLRATGDLAVPGDRIGQAPDHNSAEWSLWIGRPLLGQWWWDVRRLLDAFTAADGRLPSNVTVIGPGTAGLVALGAGVMDERIHQVVTAGSLASYVTDAPYRGQRLALMAPGLLRDAGDVAHLAALLAPRRLMVAGGVNGRGDRLPPEALAGAYQFASQAWPAAGAAGKFTLLPGGTSPATLAAWASR